MTMVASSKEVVDLRKIEGDEKMRTLEWLRGRLLAERQASRVAKEHAEFMGKKLLELHDRLKEEIKLKNKAEKKLKFFKIKLESLKPRQSTSNSSSHNSEPTVKVSEFSGKSSPIQVAKSSIFEKGHESNAFTEEHSTAQCTSPAWSSTSSLEFPSPEYQIHKKGDSKSGDHVSYSNLKSIKIEIEKEDEELDYVDNRLALVPVSMLATCETSTTENLT